MKQSSTVSKKPSIVWANNALLDEDRLDSKFYDVKFIEKQTKLLESGIPTIKLKNLMTNMNAPIGWQGIPSSAYRERREGIPLIRIQNIKDNQVDLDTVIDVDPNIYFEQPAIQAEKNDIIITRVGTIGRLCKVPSNVNKVAMGQNLTRVSFNTDELDVDYILAYMSTEYCLDQMTRFAYGGVQPSLTNKNIKDLLILLPKFGIQTYIGNKIRNAEQLREEAKQLKEEIAHIFLKNLELEMQNETNRGQKYSWIESNQIIDRIDAGYFSTKYLMLEEFEKKYDFISLSNLVLELKTGKTPSNDEDDKNGTVLIAVNNVISDNLELDNNVRKVKISDQLLFTREDDLLITRVGTVGVCSIVENYQEGLAVSDNVISVKFKKLDIPIRYIAAYLNSPTGKLQIERIVKGAVQPVINYSSIKELKIPKLDFSSMNQIDLLIRNWKDNLLKANELIQEAKQDVQFLIEGNFDESKIIETE
ncbi:restriction endonuclease S subunit [Bacillus ectoiniformans]|uniref:restriction endonuclease subunit S n=1 Tax=Bacillus ectoiniformans TaxID=1494429 RepID=UPI00195A3497|nr:restriction endonuclease subunit S [Bacillus ectoiniformans]MBM7649043.1 restriction endonuclease S subunit [Bacillus ectoiniformans]